MNNYRFKRSTRTFSDHQAELKRYVQQYYPDKVSSFEDGDIGEIFLNMNAALGDNVSFHLDRLYQEGNVNHAQQRKSLFELAANKNLKIPGKRPSVTLVEISVNVPVFGDTFDERYCPLLAPGAQFSGNGFVFETLEEVDFTSAVNNQGDPNRTIIPNVDANEQIQDYTISKTEIVYNGVTKFFSKTIGETESAPYYNMLLPAKDIIDVLDVVVVSGTNPQNNPFVRRNIPYDRFYEVDTLVQSRIFQETNEVNPDGGKSGQWVRVDNKFIVERTASGYTKIIFGGGNRDVQLFEQMAMSKGISLPQEFQNHAMGNTLPAGNTVYVKYRVGGGAASNIGANVIKTPGNVEMENEMADVREQKRTLRVSNPLPAYGGVDEPSNETIRYMIKYNEFAGGGCIRLQDYILQAYKMPGRFGAPFRVNGFKEDGKIILSILGLKQDGSLNNVSTSLLKENMSRYLAGLRSVNDYIEIRDAQIYNLSTDIKLFVGEKGNGVEIVREAVEKISSFFNVRNWQMGDNIYLGKLTEELNNIEDVINVTNMTFYNNIGADYSPNKYPGALGSGNRPNINTDDYTIYGEKDGMFEIKFPKRDIRVLIKKRG